VACVVELYIAAGGRAIRLSPKPSKTIGAKLYKTDIGRQIEMAAAMPGKTTSGSGGAK